jgi:hypothetical protein
VIIVWLGRLFNFLFKQCSAVQESKSELKKSLDVYLSRPCHASPTFRYALQLGRTVVSIVTIATVML